jgi:hypothetical protein
MLSKLSGAAVIAAGVVCVGVPVASAGNGGVNYSVACSNGDGVLDITLVHLGTEGSASFAVTSPLTGGTDEVLLDVGGARGLSYDGLNDGPMFVGIIADGVDVSIVTDVSCDPLDCPPGSAEFVSEINGVPTPQCVAVAPTPPTQPAQVPSQPAQAPRPRRSVTAPAAAAPSSYQLPATGATAEGLWLGLGLTVCGAACSLLSRRRN